MKHLFLKIVFVFIVFFNLAQQVQAIKVGLQLDVDETNVGVSVNGVVTDNFSGRPICSLEAMKSYRFKTSKDGIDIFIDGKKYSLGSKFVVISPVGDGFVSAKNRWYRGKILIVDRFNKLTIINDVKLEDYLLGVVPCEMPSSWNDEALKAQAIAARSYAVANIGKNASKGFDIKDNTDDQAYGGASSETNKTNQIVAQTYGIVITQDKQVVTAFYSASAGGKTGVLKNELPYLHSVPSYDENVKKMGHGLGMSQYGANNLAKQGYNAYQILAYYYKNIKFGKLSEKWNL